MSVTTSVLSTEDLCMFFSRHHLALAAELTKMAQELEWEQFSDDACVRTWVRRLGTQYDLFRWVASETGSIDVRAICLIRELLGYNAPIADALFAASGLAAFAVSHAASNATHETLLAKYRNGDVVFGFALSEPEAGSDPASLCTSARRQEGGFALNGHKSLITNVGVATHYVVFATVDASLGHRGITAFVVERGIPGLEEQKVVLSAEHPIGDLRFRDCFVPDDAVLGTEGSGFRTAMTVLDVFRCTVGAAAVGMAKRAYHESRDHVRKREQFGRPLVEMQIVQAYLAEMITDIDAARLLVLRAAYHRDQGQKDIAAQAAMAKLFATEAAHKIVDRAVQLFGGKGVVSGSVVERLYRAVRPLRIYEGTSEIQKLVIARTEAR